MKPPRHFDQKSKKLSQIEMFSSTETQALINKSYKKCETCSKAQIFTLRNILNELKNLNKNLDTNEKENNELVLKFAAMVVDRFCLWLVTILTIFSTIFILFTSKNFFKFT